MGINFTYGIAKMKEIQVISDKEGKAKQINFPGGATGKPTKRMWASWQKRFHLKTDMFKLFTHSEVFERISKHYPNDKIRYAIEETTDAAGNKFPPRVSGMSDPHKTPIVKLNDLLTILDETDNKDTGEGVVSYSNGIIRSRHIPRDNPSFTIHGDLFENRFYVDTPIDGVGKPMAYVGLLREICTNGVIGYAPSFRSEITMGKKNDSVEFALRRMLSTFNNPEGFDGIRNMFEQSAKAFASVNEAVKLQKAVLKVHGSGNLKKEAGKLIINSSSSDEKIEMGETPIMRKFMELTGGMNKLYATANIDTIPLKKQRLLPAGNCRVYDLLNFASEVATKFCLPAGARILHAWVGKTISQDFDLHGSGEDPNANFRDVFFSEGTADVLATLA